MRVVRSLMPLLKRILPLVLGLALLMFGLAVIPAPQGVGQTDGEVVRFQTYQVIEQNVIDLADPFETDPRYNAIDLGTIDAGAVLAVIE